MWRGARLGAAVVAPVLLIGTLAWPLLFTHSVFYFDWVTHLWFIWQQSLAIDANHTPTFFINYVHSVFDPVYAFYGGTIYSLAGTLSLVLGNAPIPTYVLTYLLDFAAAYGGWYWMGRMAGLGRWQAQIPSLVFITSAFYLQILYSSGDWAEFTAVSAIPLLIASALSVLRADRMRLWPALALVASGVVFFGSHNITILWGFTLMMLTALATLVCVPQARRQMTHAGVIRVVGLAVPSALVSAWYLLPAVTYASHTWIGSGNKQGQVHWSNLVREDMPIVSASHLFTFSSAESFPGAPNSTARLPILVIAWVLVSIALFLWMGRNKMWFRILLVASGMAVLVGVVMTHAGLILALPQPYTTLQYSVRLEIFVVMGVAGAVLAALVVARSSAGRLRHWAWTLVPILVVSVVMGGVQAAAFPPAEPGVSRTLQMQSYLRLQNDYSDIVLPHLDREGRLPRIEFPPSAVYHDRISEIVHLPPGQLVDSNIGGGPELVHVTGAKIVGIDPGFNDVLEIGPSTGGSARSAPTETISLSTAGGLPIVAGRLLALGAVLLLLGQFAVMAVRRLRPRKRRKTSRQKPMPARTGISR